MTNNELIKKSISALNPISINDADMGGVACALLSENDNIYTGVCIDTISGMGFCAEHNAISTMITNKEYGIKKIVAVKKDKNGDIYFLPPCGRCREFMYQTNNKNIETEIILDKDKSVKLKGLLPYYNWQKKY